MEEKLSILLYEFYALSHLWLYKVIILPHKGQGKLNKGNKHDYVTESASKRTISNGAFHI